MGFKDFLMQRKEQASQKYEQFKSEQKDKAEFNREMKLLEAKERKEAYAKERRHLAVTRGRVSGREAAQRPTLRDKTVSLIMGKEKAGSGVFRDDFLNVNAPNPRTSQESPLSSGLEGAMFGSEKRRRERSPIEAAFDFSERSPRRKPKRVTKKYVRGSRRSLTIRFD